jgi:hypothetical protein
LLLLLQQRIDIRAFVDRVQLFDQFRVAIEQAHQHKQRFGRLDFEFIAAEGIRLPPDKLHRAFLGEVQFTADAFHLVCHDPLGILDQFITCQA